MFVCLLTGIANSIYSKVTQTNMFGINNRKQILYEVMKKGTGWMDGCGPGKAAYDIIIFSLVLINRY